MEISKPGLSDELSRNYRLRSNGRFIPGRFSCIINRIVSEGLRSPRNVDE